MQHSVTVAEMAAPDLPPEQRIARIPADLERPWDERLKVVLSVDDSETLRELMERAARELDGMGPRGGDPQGAYGNYFAIYVDGEDVKLWRELTLVDTEGHVRWTYSWADEPYSELLRAVQAGTVRGDPRRLYLVRMGGEGDGVLADFATLLELLPMVWQAVQYGSTAYGAKNALQWLAAKIREWKRGTEVIAASSHQWQSNGAMPFKLAELLRRPHGWDPDNLGRLLGITSADTKALLTIFGCAEGDDGYWYPLSDQVSKLIAGNVDFLIHNPQVSRTAARQVIGERTDEFLRTGKAPDLDWGTYGNLPLDPYWSASVPPLDEFRPNLVTRLRRRIGEAWWRVRRASSKGIRSRRR